MYLKFLLPQVYVSLVTFIILIAGYLNILFVAHAFFHYMDLMSPVTSGRTFSLDLRLSVCPRILFIAYLWKYMIKAVIKTESEGICVLWTHVYLCRFLMFFDITTENRTCILDIYLKLTFILQANYKVIIYYWFYTCHNLYLAETESD